MVQGEVFLPGEIFLFDGLVLRATSVGQVDDIDSYAPGHQVMFGSLDYTANIRGDLIFDGFEPMSGAPRNHDEHDLRWTMLRRSHMWLLRPSIWSRSCRPRTVGWTPPRKPHTQRQ